MATENDIKMTSEVKVEDEGSVPEELGPGTELVEAAPPHADPEFLIKHPLETKWALWYFKLDKSKNWNDCLRIVASFEFVEDFWSLYNHIQPASRLTSGCDYSVFKDGIRPEWEDVGNKGGGSWQITLQRSYRETLLDSLWVEMLLCLIGEAFEDSSDEICGAVVNIRNKGDKVGLWTTHGSKDGTLKIGNKLRQRLNVPKQMPISFSMHEAAANKHGSQTRSKYTV